MRRQASRLFLLWWFRFTVIDLSLLSLSDWHDYHRLPARPIWIFMPFVSAIGAALLVYWKTLPPKRRAASDVTAPSERVVRLSGAGKKIEAIRLYREETGAGLTAAKDAVDQAAGLAR